MYEQYIFRIFKSENWKVSSKLLRKQAVEISFYFTFLANIGIGDGSYPSPDILLGLFSKNESIFQKKKDYKARSS